MNPTFSLAFGRHANLKTRVHKFKFEDELNDTYSLEVEFSAPDLRGVEVRELCNSMRGDTAEFTVERVLDDSTVIKERIVGMVIQASRGASGYHEQGARLGTGDSMEHRDDIIVVRCGPAFDTLEHHQRRAGSFSGYTYAELAERELKKALPDREFEFHESTQGRSADPYVFPISTSMRQWVRALFEEAGFNYYFSHEGSVEKMVVVASNVAFQDGQNNMPSGEPFRVNYAGALPGNERIRSALASAQVSAKAAHAATFNETGTPAVIRETATAPGTSTAERVAWQPVRALEGGKVSEQYKRLAKQMVDRESSILSSVELECNILGMRVGKRFRLELSRGKTGDYVCVRTSVTGEFRRDHDDVYAPYFCKATLVPVDLDEAGVVIRALHPPEDPKLSVTTADIIAVENAPIQVDKYLRCRLRYTWQEDQDEVPLVDVAVMQTNAGRFGGSHYIPRQGDRVVVAHFLDNPRIPVILGCLYDERRQPPFMGPPDGGAQLPKSAYWLGWSHASVDGTSPSLDRRSMLAVDVTANHELFYINAPHDYRLDIDNDSATTVKQGNVTHDVKTGNVTEKIAKDYTQEVGSNRKEKVAQQYDLEVGKQLTIKVGQDFLNWSQSGELRTNAKKVQHHQAKDSYTIEAKNIYLRGDVDSGSMGAPVRSSLELAENTQLLAPAGVTIKGGTSTVDGDDDGVRISGQSAKLADADGGTATLADGKLVIDVPRSITLRCGSTVVELNPDGVVIRADRMEIRSQELLLEGQRVEVEGTDFSVSSERTTITSSRVDISGIPSRES